jgi:hypothetical protein
MGQVLLVRHGQASWGAEDYDALSETGWEQSRLLGRALAGAGSSDPRRPRLDAPAPRDCRGCRARRPCDRRPRLGRVRPPRDAGRRAVARRRPHADPRGVPGLVRGGHRPLDRWRARHGYAETFDAFGDRVTAALRRTAEAAPSGTAVVLTSGGPTAWAVATLLGADLERGGRVRLWRRLNPVCVNSGVTKLVTGGAA